MGTQSVTFRLITGKKDGTYTLKRGMGLKEGVMRNISYRPGAKSIYDEDNEKNAVKPEAVVFRYNDILNDPAVQIIVPATNKTLLDFLRTHELYGRHYIEYDADKEAAKDLTLYDDKERAFELVRESDDIKSQAKAMVLFGISVFNESINVIKKKLKETADKNPRAVIKAFEAEDYTGKYLAGLAFCSGIIKTNLTHTAVIWNDASQGVIIPVAKGENGIDKLGELLSMKTDQSETLLQEFQARLDKAGAKEANGMTLTEGVVAEKQKALDEKDAEIEALKKQLAEAKKATAEPVNYSGLSLEEATELYKEQKGKDVPPAQTKNREWIISKLT